MCAANTISDQGRLVETTVTGTVGRDNRDVMLASQAPLRDLGSGISRSCGRGGILWSGRVFLTSQETGQAALDPRRPRSTQAVGRHGGGLQSTGQARGGGGEWS